MQRLEAFSRQRMVLMSEELEDQDTPIVWELQEDGTFKRAILE